MHYLHLILLLCSLLRQQPEIPVLCYHNFDNKPPDQLHITPDAFYNQMKWLSDHHYHCITPDQLYDHLSRNMPLPDSSFLLSLDDGHSQHCTVVLPILQEFNFKGVFFIMTVCLNKPGWLSITQLKAIAAQGHFIGCHTWDHPYLTKTDTPFVQKQLIKPRQELEHLIGRPVVYFAYPFGAWNESVVDDLKRAGIKAAFQLDNKNMSQFPIYTIRRIMVSGKWSGEELAACMKKYFH